MRLLFPSHFFGITAAMAEPTATPGTYSTPALPSTADQLPYVPVSWLAVGAASLAGLLALLLLILGILSFLAHKPLLEEELLILAVAAIVLSFAARRVLRNSEGTRTGSLFGIDLPNAAWWTGLVLGLGYISYLLAIEYSIRNDARNEVKAWSDLVLKGDPDSLNRAFHRTQDPNQRKGIGPSDGQRMELRWRNEIIGFRQCDLVRLIARNPDSKLELGGLRDWAFKPNGVECNFTAKLTNAEGTFPIQVGMRGMDGGPEGGGRQWQIHFTSAGFIQGDMVSITPYGWYVGQLGRLGGEFGRRFIAASSNRESRPYAFLDFTQANPNDSEFLRPLTLDSQRARNVVVSVAAGIAWKPGPAVYDYTADLLFTLPGGEKPNDDLKKAFRTAWDKMGIVKSGERLMQSPDQNDHLTITDSQIEIQIPIEIPTNNTRGDISAARGRLVIVCTDPSVVTEARRLRESANPAQTTATPPEGLTTKTIPWKVIRIESDMKKVEQRAPGGGPGAPGSPEGY